MGFAQRFARALNPSYASAPSEQLPLMTRSDIRRGTALALLLAIVTLGLVGLILIAAKATEREHRKW